MTNEQIKEIALKNGFKLKEQPNGEMDLNPYVYDFARALVDSRWISVKDRLPSERDRYLVFYEDVEYCGTSRFYDGIINKFDVDHSTISHWMPLPPPPIEVPDDL